MNDNKAYAVSRKKNCMLKTIFKLVNVLTLFFSLIIIPFFSFGQDEPQYDEVNVYLKVQGVGGAEIPALIKNSTAYLSISDVFTLIKIKNTASSRLDSLSGFFINPQDEYLIDRKKKQITFQGKKIELKTDDLILTETNLYMKSNLFGDVFGLNCAFNMRDLSVIMTTKLELPLIREMKMEQMRNNLKRLKGDVKTDTTIGRRYPLFKFGMADWAINSTQQQGGAPNTQVNLSLGSVMAGGEMNVGLNYYSASKFDVNQQTYLWRYVNNDFKALRQVLIGKIGTQTISTLNGSLLGVQLTNTPTIYRRSFGTYTLSNITEPNWLVELYVNNVLVDYIKADASGFYKFEVPLVYGISVLTVRMYGPWGEVRTRVENANIPFNFLPPGELEYTVNAGVVENMFNTKLYRTNVNYGVSRRISIGGGYEYYSSPTVNNSLPFVGSSVMLLNDLLMAAEYTVGVQVKSSLSYRLPSNLQVDLNYTNYEKGQKAILNAPVQERGFSLAIPLQKKKFSLYSRLSLSQMVYSNYKTTSSEFLFSGNLSGVSSNITTSLMFQDPKHITSSSNFSLSFGLPGHFVMNPSVLYDYNQKRLISIHCNLDKPLFGNGYLNIAYERNILSKINSVNVGLRYDFSFMQTGIAARLVKNSNSFSQSARGSLLFDTKNHKTETSVASTVGRGAFTFIAYLDLNGNEKRDENEPKILGLNVRVNGGRIVKSDKDSTIRVIDLTPYTSYLVELDKNNFENISWKIKNKTLSVFADPNQFKVIEVPISVMAEAAGTVNVKSKSGSRGLGRVYVSFYRNGTKLIGKTLTESDGYFSYMGLSPGNYIARMDSVQLTKIKMKATPEFKEFKVKESRDGDFVEGLDFTLQSTVKDSTNGVIPNVEPKAVPVDKIINYADAGVKKADVGSGDEMKPVLEKQTDKQKTIEKQSSILANNIPGVRYSQGLPDITKHGEVKNKSDKFYTKSIPDVTKTDSSKLQTRKQEPQITGIYGQSYSVRYGVYNAESDALAMQQKIATTTGVPAMIVLENGAYTLWIEGFSSNRAARAYITSLEKLEKQHVGVQKMISQNITNNDSVTVIRNNAIVSSVNKSKNINYGPWKIQNNLVVYADSITKIYTFEPKGSKTRGYPTRINQPSISNMITNTVVKPLPIPVQSIIVQKNIVDQTPKAIINGANVQQFSVQVGDFIFDRSAILALKKISTITNMHVVMVLKNGFYNLLIEGFATRREAKLFIDQLSQLGFKGTVEKSIH
jgi:uncharacterized protein (UPF0332 family)